MKRRSFLILGTLLAAAVAGGSLLGSCGQASAKSKPGHRVIEIWQGFNFEETAVFREIMKDFEADYAKRTGETLEIRVQYVSFNDMFTKLRTAALAKMTPDIAFMDSIKVTELALGQALVPIDELDSFKKRYGTRADARKEFVGASFDASIVNRLGEEHLFGMPVQTTTVSLFWNKAIFRQRSEQLRAAGLDPNRAPRDWDEMDAYGKALTDPERRLFAFGLSGSLWFNFPFFNMYDANFVKYDESGTGSPALDTPNGLAALTRIQTIATSGWEGGAWQRSALGPEAGFINDIYAMCITGPWNVENFTNAGKEFDIALIPGPTLEESKRLGIQPRVPGGSPDDPSSYSSSNVGGQTGVILRLCEERDLSFEILDYFTSEPVQRRWASQLGQIPVRLSAWEDLDTSKFPFMPMFMKQLASAKRIPQIPLYGILENDIYNPEVDLLLNKRQDAATMVRKMETKMNSRIFERVNDSVRHARATADASK